MNDLFSVKFDYTDQTPLHFDNEQVYHPRTAASSDGWCARVGGGGDIINKQRGITKASLWFIVTGFCVELNDLNLNLIVP